MKVKTTDAIGITRERTEDGYLLGQAVITQAGKSTYLRKELGLEGNPEEQVVVRRTEETVRHPKTVDSLRMRPITVGHPQEWPPDGNAPIAGSTGESVSVKDGVVSAKIAIHGEDGLKQLEVGSDQVSAGYTWSLEPSDEEGVDYTSGDAPMNFNHIALVTKGRLGPNVRVLDSGENMPEDNIEKIAEAVIKKLAEAKKAKTSDEAFEDRVKEAAFRRAEVLSAASRVMDAESHAAVANKGEKDILVEAVGETFTDATDRSTEYLLGVLHERIRSNGTKKKSTDEMLMKSTDSKSTDAYSKYVQSLDFRSQE